MPVVGQTPCVIVKAGSGAVVFPPECVVALANIGLQPEDFGTYSQVRARQSAARAKVKAAAASGGSGGSQIDGAPTDHDRFLAQCTSGHLTPNATQQRQRGNACSNATDGYSDSEAPCAPHFGSASEPGTEHYLVTRQENAAKPPPGGAPIGSDADKQTYPPGQRAADDAARGKKVQGAIAGNKQDYPKDMKPANSGDQQGAENTFKNMQDARAKSAAAAKDTTAFKEAAGKLDPKDLDLVNKDESGDLAAACIEAFRQAGMRAMKEKAASPEAIAAAKADAAEANKPSDKDPSKTNKQMAQADADSAKAREAAAKQAKDDQKDTHDKQKADLKAEQDKARDAEKAKHKDEREALAKRQEEDHQKVVDEHQQKIDAAPPGQKQALIADRSDAAAQSRADQKAERAELNDSHKEESDQRRGADDKQQAELRDQQKGERASADKNAADARGERESTQAKVDRYNDAQCRADQGERLQNGGLAEGGSDGLAGGFGKKPNPRNAVSAEIDADATDL